MNLKGSFKLDKLKGNIMKMIPNGTVCDYLYNFYSNIMERPTLRRVGHFNFESRNTVIIIVMLF